MQHTTQGVEDRTLAVIRAALKADEKASDDVKRTVLASARYGIPTTAWLTKRQAAAYLQIGLRTLESWIAEGRVRVRRFSGKVLRVRREWLDEIKEVRE